MLKVFYGVSACGGESEESGAPESHRTLVFIWPRHYLGGGSGRAEREVEISSLPQPPSRLHEAPVLGPQTGTSRKL